MDTTTVLEIIEMIDVRIAKYEALEEASMDMDFSYQGVIYEAKDIRDHLQSCIEGQLNTAELQSGE